LAAYNFLAGQAPTLNLTGTDLGGLTLTEGVYKFDSSAQLTGTLTLDAQGNDNAVFIFEIGSTLTTANNAMVSLLDGGPNDGVFWQIGSSVTLGDGTMFTGNLLANTSITLDPFARISCGRALAGVEAVSGAVTMADTNHVAINDGFNCNGGYGGGYDKTTAGGFERVNEGNFVAVDVSEPSSLALFFIGLIGLGVLAHRHQASFHHGRCASGLWMIFTSTGSG